MSSQEVKKKLRTTIKSIADLMDTLVKAAQGELSAKVPKVMHTLDSSFEQASKALADAFSTIDKKTSKEQVELYRAYKGFLSKQIELLERRINELERQSR
jgi:paraquat-inducible protein B